MPKVWLPPIEASNNHLLAAMTRAERQVILGAAEHVALPPGTVLFAPGEEIRYVTFPTSGLVSLTADRPGEEGVEGVEVAMIGREGLVGLPPLLGDPVAQARAVVQVRGYGYQAEASAVAFLADGSRNLRGVIHRFTLAALFHVQRNAACNATHPLEQRTARWLLTMADRVGPNLPVTQEFVAAMLGARRPTVNGVVTAFRDAGLIRYARGQIAVADYARLEAVSCPCYRLLRAAHERLFPHAFG